MCFNLASLHSGCHHIFSRAIFWGKCPQKQKPHIEVPNSERSTVGKSVGERSLRDDQFVEIRHLITQWPVLINSSYPITLWWPTECWSLGPAQLPLYVRGVQSHYWKCRWRNSQLLSFPMPNFGLLYRYVSYISYLRWMTWLSLPAAFCHLSTNCGAPHDWSDPAG